MFKRGSYETLVCNLKCSFFFLFTCLCIYPAPRRNWTIIRPGGLVSEAETKKAILTEDTMAIGSIHREDVADLVVQALSSKSTEKKILSAVDPSLASAANPEGRTSEAFALA